MIITAKFSSICPACSNHIAVGEKVEWSKGRKAAHVACAGSTTPAAPKTYGARVEASRRMWGARRGMGSGHGTATKMPGYSGYCTDNESCRCYDCQ